MAGYVWPTLVGTFPAGSTEWHAARAAGVGGSEVAPVLMLSPFESRFALWHRKAGNLPPQEATPAMEWGTRLEAAIVRKMLDEHPEWVGAFADHNHGPQDSATFAHPDRPWQVANPDEILLAPGRWQAKGGGALPAMDQRIRPAGIGEAKASQYGDGFGPTGTDQVPIYYRTQCLWYLDTFGLYDEACTLGALIGGADYREYTIEYDAGDALVMRLAAEEFLQSIGEGMPPDPDDMEATWQAVRMLHPDIDGTTVDVPDDIARLYLAGVQQLEAAKRAERYGRSVLAEYIGSAKRAHWRGAKIADRRARSEDAVPYVQKAGKLPDVLGPPAQLTYGWRDHPDHGGETA